MYRDPWAKKSQRGLRTLTKIGTAIAKAHTQYQREQKRATREAERRATAYNRMLIQNERERLRRIKQNEVAMRRAERERAKAERERERALKLQQKLQEQRLFEEEVKEIEDDNFLWTNVHSFIDDIITRRDIDDALSKCDYERQNDVDDGFFDKKKPSMQPIKQRAENEASKKFDSVSLQRELTEAEDNLQSLTFEEVEPTKESVEQLLLEEAKESIKAFLPWKQKRLRREFVESNIDGRYKELHDSWLSRKDSYESRKSELKSIVDQKNAKLDIIREAKKKFTFDRAKELFEAQLNEWRSERDEFYDSFKQNFQNVIDGDKDYVITAIDSVFPDDELPMEYFVDAVYDEANGKVYVDLDLPEIEDVPNQKITLTSTGKKSIRQKSQTDLRTDYANCILGLAMNVAFSIFNVSLKISEVEIMGYTQRKEDNSAIATDQYVFVINFDRDTFSKIDFNRLSPTQILNFFQHHILLSKSFVLKQIDLSTAFDKMESFVVGDYDEFKKTLPIERKPITPQSKGNIRTSRPINNTSSSSSSYTTSSSQSNQSQGIYVDDAPIETFEKGTVFMSKMYNFIDRLSKDAGVNRHADNLNGVKITMTGGNFPGDGNTSTYRGKLFFCCILDLYRTLSMMQVSTDRLTPSNYPLARFALKIFGQLDFSYQTISVVQKTYASLIQLLKSMDSGIPTPHGVFLIGEILRDYERNMSWYKQYLELIGDFASIVKESVHSNTQSRVRAEFFIRRMASRGIDIPYRK